MEVVTAFEDVYGGAFAEEPAPEAAEEDAEEPAPAEEENAEEPAPAEEENVEEPAPPGSCCWGWVPKAAKGLADVVFAFDPEGSRALANASRFARQDWKVGAGAGWYANQAVHPAGVAPGAPTQPDPGGVCGSCCSPGTGAPREVGCPGSP